MSTTGYAHQEQKKLRDNPSHQVGPWETEGPVPGNGDGNTGY